MHGNGKRESCASSATTTTLLGPHGCNQRIGSNGALHMYAIPRTISPLMQVHILLLILLKIFILIYLILGRINREFSLRGILIIKYLYTLFKDSCV